MVVVRCKIRLLTKDVTRSCDTHKEQVFTSKMHLILNFKLQHPLNIQIIDFLP